MDEITLICETCRQPMTDAAAGSLSITYDGIRRAQAEQHDDGEGQAFSIEEFLAQPDGPCWRSRHYRCEPEGDEGEYAIGHDVLRTWSDLARWTAHLLGKNWLPGTDWDCVLREAAGESPARRIRAIERQAA